MIISQSLIAALNVKEPNYVIKFVRIVPGHFANEFIIPDSLYNREWVNNLNRPVRPLCVCVCVCGYVDMGQNCRLCSRFPGSGGTRFGDAVFVL